MTTSRVTLREVSTRDRESVLQLRAAPHQRAWVADVTTSLAEVVHNPSLTAFAVYDASQRGLPEPTQRPVGFAVTEVVASVGFVLRLLIDGPHQRRGYGAASMAELVRRLRLDPQVEMVATSHRRDNRPMADLCATLGFVPWATPFEPPMDEVYLRLPDR